MDNSSRQQRFPLSFMGGPLDGYVDETYIPLDRMPEVMGILVSPNIVEMLTTQRLEQEMPPTSLAFYQQINTQERRYSFVGSTSPDAIEFSDVQSQHQR